MRQSYRWLLGLGLLTLLFVLLGGHFHDHGHQNPHYYSPVFPGPTGKEQLWGQAVQAQTPDTVPETEPPVNIPEVVNQYNDAMGRFKVGILDTYQVSSVGPTPLFEAPDGSIAYTVIALPAPDRVTDITLIQAATDLFQRGEGFQVVRTRSTTAGLSLNWTGSLTIGGQTQPMQGSILVQQTEQTPDNTVVALLIAATDAGAEQLPAVMDTLGQSLELE